MMDIGEMGAFVVESSGDLVFKGNCCEAAHFLNVAGNGIYARSEQIFNLLEY